MKQSKLLKNFSYSFLANVSSTVISMVLVLFVPKLLGVTEYSYWQLYLFYASYVGFFHFGWADGVYLQFGGKKYEELDRNYFHTQFWLLTILEVAIAVIICILAFFFAPNESKLYVFLAVGVCCVLQIPRTFLQYLLQATNKIVNYAKNFLWEKFIYAGLITLFLAVGIRDFKVLVLADLIARGVTLILLVRECRGIVFSGAVDFITGITNAWQNVTIGIKLMFANIASNLLLGIVRWSIENHWSIEQFGKVSLSITASNLLMTCISAVSIVIYPMLKNIDEKKYSDVYSRMRNYLMIPVLGLLIVYYPAKTILSWWLPNYADSLRFMALLFPMCVFESKMTMLVNTFLKVIRKEKTILIVNLISVGITILSTAFFVYLLSNLTLAILSLTILLAIRCSIGEIVLAKYINCRVYKDMAYEWILSAVFIACGWLIDSWIVFVLYGVAYSGYLIIKRKSVKELLVFAKNQIGKK